VVVNRPGFGENPSVERVDFEVDAPLVAELLGDGAHLVGHSYGGVVSLLAAAGRPEAVWSLTVAEPPAFAVASGHLAVADLVAALRKHWDEAPRDPEAFLRAFLELVGSAIDLPSPLPPSLQRGAEMLLVERGPWEAATFSSSDSGRSEPSFPAPATACSAPEHRSTSGWKLFCSRPTD
jgi:pimeloyl-ACP methyl ester carboxylesterase